MGYPTVELNEEVMREGMQIESADIAIEDKVALLEAISECGLQAINVGSFVSPKYTPQMADIEDVLKRFTPRPGPLYHALVMNQRGVERASAYEFLQPRTAVPATTVHLCDTFVRRNQNRTQADEIASWNGTVERATRAGVTEAAIFLGAAWGSNFEGLFTLKQRLDMLRRQHCLWDDAGIRVTTASLADPMSWCMPHRVEETLEAVRSEWPDIRTFHLHNHDARGMALPSIYAALRVLDETCHLMLDVTAGGIGGCPYCGNGRATGMAATEDVVVMLHEMDIETGVDLDRLIEFVWHLEEVLGRLTPGHVSKAGPLPHTESDLYDPNLPFVETHVQARHFRRGPSVLGGATRPWGEAIPEPVLKRDAP